MFDLPLPVIGTVDKLYGARSNTGTELVHT